TCSIENSRLGATGVVFRISGKVLMTAAVTRNGKWGQINAGGQAAQPTCRDRSRPDRLTRARR
ncbi:MAG: hypothetical protein L7T80_10690, partial [Arenicellales bacterium]|nr:hypothetical protein [Arenicellales bacterium]